MINGLLIYRSYEDHFNIGDYIQSLAAQQFFPDGIGKYLNREELNCYYGETVKLIVNGWFMHEPQNWPPSPDIYPLFVSFHINSAAQEVLLGPEGVEYLKKWQPIGCRDKKTVELLEHHGIKAHLSGCLTLTLGLNYSSAEKRNGVFFIDPYFEVGRDLGSIIEYSFQLLWNFTKIRFISSKLFGNNNIASMIRSAAFYSDYQKVFDDSIVETMTFMRHRAKGSDFDSEKEKFEYAEKLLRCYAEAELIVTSRMHCALPCIGLNTPVIYVENTEQDEISACRLDGVKELLNIITYKKGKMKITFSDSKKVDLDSGFKNKKDFLKYTDLLIEECRRFAKS